MAIRPGKPLIFGHYNNVPMLGLPGNPASAYVCSIVFALPIIYKLQGSTSPITPIKAQLAHDLPANGNRRNYLRAQYQIDINGQLIIQTTARQDSAKLSTLAWANCLAIQEVDSPALKAGDLIDIIRL